MIKLRILRWGGYFRSPRWAKNENDMYPCKRETLGHLTHKGEGRRNRESFEDGDIEIGVMWIQAKECQPPPEVGRGKEQILPWNLQRQHDLVDTLI